MTCQKCEQMELQLEELKDLREAVPAMYAIQNGMERMTCDLRAMDSFKEEIAMLKKEIKELEEKTFQGSF